MFGAHSEAFEISKNPIKDLHTNLDKAVMEAYSFSEHEDLLAQLLALNL